jgi:hypothetical protein
MMMVVAVEEDVLLAAETPATMTLAPALIDSSKVSPVS